MCGFFPTFFHENLQTTILVKQEKIVHTSPPCGVCRVDDEGSGTGTNFLAVVAACSCIILLIADACGGCGLRGEGNVRRNESREENERS
jgi:hypothetical protein